MPGPNRRLLAGMAHLPRCHSLTNGLRNPEF